MFESQVPTWARLRQCGELKFKPCPESCQHLMADCASNKIISGEWNECGEKMVDLSKDTWFCKCINHTTSI
jgi:hypothetical protein